MSTELGLFQEGCRLFIHVKPDGLVCRQKNCICGRRWSLPTTRLTDCSKLSLSTALLLRTLLPLRCFNIGAFQKQIFIKSIQNLTELILSGTVYGFIVNLIIIISKL